MELNLKTEKSKGMEAKKHTLQRYDSHRIAWPKYIIPKKWPFLILISLLLEIHYQEVAGVVWVRRSCGQAESKGSNGKENGGEPFVTDNGNYIVDLYFKRDIGSLKAASNAILRLAGVVEHDMFLDMAKTIIVAGELDHHQD
ncbi:hypothetical protein GH714_035654 [Hevea brasiliensis]|uniref:Uncharacterized protein n=1 Tax=Hevea brasiliensis TaxID=3981 RepID=A0A6A6KV17_HEVBR|nr:hypothetical protein GH714_035654 [Hevea brasiliensis]